MAPNIDRSSAMGAAIWPDGAGFRTWAPNARSVAVVAGDRLASAVADAAWRPGPADLLAPLGDGSWGGFVAGLGAGQPYLFFIDGVGSAGWKRDPRACELSVTPAFPSSFCLLHDPASYPWHDAGWTPPAFSDLVLYQLHVGTWWAQDEAGNDMRTRRGGTFLDVIEKLPHLRALGVNAIQLLPVQEFETRFSLGYNGVDYFSPESDYCVPPAELAWRLTGINASLAAAGHPGLSPQQLAPGVNQLRCLIDLCHLNGIAVILDIVYNHAGGGFDDRSLWFYDRQADDNQNHSLYFTDQGWAGGQIFAYWNDRVAQFLIDNAVYFLRDFHVDGFRYDEVRVIENNGGRLFCQNLTQTVRATNAAVIQIAEYWNPDRSSAIRPPPEGLGFDAELGDGLRDALRGLLRQAAAGASAALDLGDLARALAPATPDAWRLVQCLENQDLTYSGHSDAARVAMLADPSDRRSWYGRSRARVATALLLAAAGIPALFMGEELLEDRNWSDDRGSDGLIGWQALASDKIRRDFLACVSDLIRLRHAQPALGGGGSRVSRADSFGRVLVLHRWVEWEGRDVVLVASLDEAPKHGYRIGLPWAGEWQELFNSDAYDNFPNAAAVGNGGFVRTDGGPLDGFAASGSLTLPANGVIVLARR